MLGRRKLLVGAIFITITALAGCGSRIVVPVRVCLIQGSDLSTATPAMQEAALTQQFNLVNGFWNAKADIHFMPQLQEGGPHLIIADPDPLAIGVMAKLGDVDIGRQRETSEMVAAYLNCSTAWGAHATGLVVLVARDLVSATDPAVVGAGPGHASTLARNEGRDLCQFPRRLFAKDVAGQYALVPEPQRFRIKPGGPDRSGTFADTLSHELGHALLLAHGDGQDNDQNSGVSPPAPGPRLFDQSCDPSEFTRIDESPDTITVSLMSPSGGMTLGLTTLQRELARDAAILVPGAATGFPTLWP